MGADRRGPLAAFIILAVIAVILLVTSVRSQAASGWFHSTVVAGAGTPRHDRPSTVGQKPTPSAAVHDHGRHLGWYRSHGNGRGNGYGNGRAPGHDGSRGGLPVAVRGHGRGH